MSNAGFFGRTATANTGGVWKANDVSNFRRDSVWPISSIVTSGLVFHLDAANTSSYSGTSTWTNLGSSGSVSNVTLFNSPTYDGKSLQFNPDLLQYGTLSNSSSPFRQTSAITYEGWVNFTGSIGGNRFGGTTTSGGQGTGGVLLTYNGLYFSWTPTTPQSDTTITATFSSLFNTWFHYAFTMNYSTGVYAAYINGSSISTSIARTVTNFTPVTSYNQAANDELPSRNINSTRLYSDNVKISQYRIYNTALSAANVAQNYESTILNFR